MNCVARIPSEKTPGSSSLPRVHTCLECGKQRKPKGDFCSGRCRVRFNNRRKTRGAELYDLYMAHRFERADAAALGVFQAINRLASVYRQEDNAERHGRKSWRPPRAVIGERPWLKSITTAIRSGR